jgi:hypothetical protein
MDTSEKHMEERKGFLPASFSNSLRTLKRFLEHEIVRTLSILVLLVTPVIYAWLSWARWVIGHFEQVVADPSEKASSVAIEKILSLAGTFGDLFGGINALFTGLGLAFLIYTIFQQSKMIHQQQLAIDQQNEDLRNQKTAAERSQALQSMLQIRAVLQDEETRKAREIVLSGVGKPTDIWLLTQMLLKKSLNGTQSLNDKEKETLQWYLAAERVLHTYDFVGVLEACGHFQQEDLNIIKNTWGESITRCHSELQSYLTVPFRPKGITQSDTDAIDNMDKLREKFPKDRLHGLPYANFVTLVGKML